MIVRFQRIQFPIRLAFAITINKAQGQTLNKVGIDLKYVEIFLHGQLYTAFSRVRTAHSIKVVTGGTKEKKNWVTNIVRCLAKKM